MNKDFSIAIMYAVTPCHAGSGSALGVVDLPIQRERHTNWPMIQASGVKGAFRANFERYKNNLSDEEKAKVKEINKLADSIFGTSEGTGYAGSSSFSDAKILAYPMRSNVSPFVWITCPAVLKRLQKDLAFTGEDIAKCKIPEVKENEAVLIKGSISGDVLLEDYEVKVSNDKKVEGFDAWFAGTDRLILVSDEVFNYGVTNCTQIMAQIKIDSKTGTTADGSLRYQEELPSDTLMYTVIHWGDSKNTAEDKLKADTIKRFITEEVIKNHIQIAGDETCGRGIFELTWK
jgi:CRISPR-associated protein Cmr4